MNWEILSLTLQVVAALASAAAAAIAAWTTYRAPLIAATMSNDLSRRDARYDRKLDCLRRVAGLRVMPPSPEWLASLNEIVVTFNDANAVIDCLKKFQTAAMHGGHSNNDLLDLIKSMMDDLGLNRSAINDDILLTFLSGSVQPAK